MIFAEISTDQPYYVNNVELMPTGVLQNKMCSGKISPQNNC